MATLWLVPPIFRGKTVAILAGGSGMSMRVADEVCAADIPAIAINNSYLLAPWADILVANDAGWWGAHPEALKFAGIKFCAQTGCCPHPEVMELKNTGQRHDECGYDPDPAHIRTGSNSGYTAVHIAMQAGARRILLCGMNMGGDNWHPPHEKPLRVTRQQTYANWIRRFATLVQPAAERGIEIINCTTGSALKCFPAGDIERYLYEE